MEITDSLDSNLGSMPVPFKNFPKATFPQLSVMIDDDIKLTH